MSHDHFNVSYILWCHHPNPVQATLLWNNLHFHQLITSTKTYMSRIQTIWHTYLYLKSFKGLCLKPLKRLSYKNKTYYSFTSTVIPPYKSFSSVSLDLVFTTNIWGTQYELHLFQICPYEKAKVGVCETCLRQAKSLSNLLAKQVTSKLAERSRRVITPDWSSQLRGC